jgi:hypothetical protein
VADGEILTGDESRYLAIEQNMAAEAQAAGGINPLGPEADGEL